MVAKLSLDGYQLIRRMAGSDAATPMVVGHIAANNATLDLDTVSPVQRSIIADQ
jgi:hypothetical protein